MKKIKFLFMTLAVMAVALSFTSCEEQLVDETVWVEYKTYNGDDVYLKYADASDFNSAFQSALKQAEGTKNTSMANTVKNYFKSNIKMFLVSSDITILKKNNVYWIITVKNMAKTKTYGTATLKASEL